MKDAPDWIDPANDRKTPYTDEELKMVLWGAVSFLTLNDSYKRAIRFSAKAGI